jgi:hypothetical protein
MRIEKFQKTFRMLSKADFNEFKQAATESIDSNMEYLYFGQFFATQVPSYQRSELGG